jgi:uncharacterized protein YdhG (YjbR/CyaY superfamily)
MQSKANDVASYIDEIPEERRDAVATLLKLIRDNLPEGYEEAMNSGMICWQVPLADFADTYNGKPLMYAALANQKNHIGLYLCGLYCMPGLEQQFRDGFAKAGKKLDMGKACVRVKALDKIDLDAVATVIAAVPMDAYVAQSKAVHAAAKRGS